MTLARAFVTGTVTRPPEKRFTQNDMAIVGFTVNIDKNNETLLRVVAFGQLAENISSGIQVGDEVAVDGKLQVNTFKLPNGKDKKVYEISASCVEKISANSSYSPTSNSDDNIVTFDKTEPVQDLIDEEEIPF